MRAAAARLGDEREGAIAGGAKAPNTVAPKIAPPLDSTERN